MKAVVGMRANFFVGEGGQISKKIFRLKKLWYVWKRRSHLKNFLNQESQLERKKHKMFSSNTNALMKIKKITSRSWFLIPFLKKHLSFFASGVAFCYAQLQKLRTREKCEHTQVGNSPFAFPPRFWFPFQGLPFERGLIPSKTALVPPNWVPRSIWACTPNCPSRIQNCQFHVRDFSTNSLNLRPAVFARFNTSNCSKLTIHVCMSVGKLRWLKSCLLLISFWWESQICRIVFRWAKVWSNNSDITKVVCSTFAGSWQSSSWCCLFVAFKMPSNGRSGINHTVHLSMRRSRSPRTYKVPTESGMSDTLLRLENEVLLFGNFSTPLQKMAALTQNWKLGGLRWIARDCFGL